MGNIVIPISNNKAAAHHKQKNIISNFNYLSKAKQDIQKTQIDCYQNFIDNLYGKCNTRESYKEELKKYYGELKQMTSQNANSSITNNTDSNKSPKQTILENILKNFTGYYITHYDDYIKGDYQSKDNKNKLNHDTLSHAIMLDPKAYLDYYNECINKSNSSNCALCNIEIIDNNGQQIKSTNATTLCKEIKNTTSKYATMDSGKYALAFIQFFENILCKYPDQKIRELFEILQKAVASLKQYESQFPHSKPTASSMNMFYRMADLELRFLFAIYNILLKNINNPKSNENKINNINNSKSNNNNNNEVTVNINIFTYYDMCQFCWLMWHKCLPELQKLFSNYLNTSVNLKLNVYYVESYHSSKLLNGLENGQDAVELEYIKEIEKILRKREQKMQKQSKNGESTIEPKYIKEIKKILRKREQEMQEQSKNGESTIEPKYIKEIKKILQKRKDVEQHIKNSFIFFNAFSRCNDIPGALSSFNQAIELKVKELETNQDNTQSSIQRFYDDTTEQQIKFIENMAYTKFTSQIFDQIFNNYDKLHSSKDVLSQIQNIIMFLKNWKITADNRTLDQEIVLTLDIPHFSNKLIESLSTKNLQCIQQYIKYDSEFKQTKNDAQQKQGANKAQPAFVKFTFNIKNILTLFYALLSSHDKNNNEVNKKKLLCLHDYINKINMLKRPKQQYTNKNVMINNK